MKMRSCRACGAARREWFLACLVLLWTCFGRAGVWGPLQLHLATCSARCGSGWGRLAEDLSVPVKKLARCNAPTLRSLSTQQRSVVLVKTVVRVVLCLMGLCLTRNLLLVFVLLGLFVAPRVVELVQKLVVRMGVFLEIHVSARLPERRGKRPGPLREALPISVVSRPQYTPAPHFTEVSGRLWSGASFRSRLGVWPVTD